METTESKPSIAYGPSLERLNPAFNPSSTPNPAKDMADLQELIEKMARAEIPSP